MLAHVILHLALCGSILKAGPNATVAVRVQLTDRAAIERLNKVITFDRGDGAEHLIEFDVPVGNYRMDLSAAKFGCSASEFVMFLPDIQRVMSVALTDGRAIASVPILFQGPAPATFLYAKPTLVLVDKSVACDKPVGDTTQSNLSVENDDDAFFATLPFDPNAAPATLALRLQTPTHQYHYIRVPAPYPPPAIHWPYVITFDVTQNTIDGIATMPVDTLLCLKLWETTSH